MAHYHELPSLNLDASLEGEGLVLRYRLLNTLAEHLFVLDRPAPFGSPPEASVCYGGELLALFLHGICPPPPSPPFPPYQTALVYPGATRVESEQELVREVVAPLPLVERTPYSSSSTALATPVSIRRVRFIVQFIRKRNVTEARERKEAKGVYYATGKVERLVAEAFLARQVVLQVCLVPELRFSLGP
jgi:hypothetical protein